jgi:hypothetical protein
MCGNLVRSLVPVIIREQSLTRYEGDKKKTFNVYIYIYIYIYIFEELYLLGCYAVWLL